VRMTGRWLVLGGRWCGVLGGLCGVVWFGRSAVFLVYWGRRLFKLGSGIRLVGGWVLVSGVAMRSVLSWGVGRLVVSAWVSWVSGVAGVWVWWSS
jgi:hypothetical protein